jgi:hypothetical protein
LWEGGRAHRERERERERERDGWLDSSSNKKKSRGSLKEWERRWLW